MKFGRVRNPFSKAECNGNDDAENGDVFDFSRRESSPRWEQPVRSEDHRREFGEIQKGFYQYTKQKMTQMPVMIFG